MLTARRMWVVVAVLAMPTLGWIGYSLVHAARGGAARAGSSKGPWVMQESGTTAGLRGIDSVDGKVAWASGTGGTVLRTVDGGAHWGKCAVPDGTGIGTGDGATLDFRGVQAWDEKSAVVMASGPGEKSRLYKTVDGCGSWRLLLKNQDKDGFWDSLRYAFLDDGTHYLLLGDPVNGRFFVRGIDASTGELRPLRDPSGQESLKAVDKAGAYAASNSSMILAGRGVTPLRGRNQGSIDLCALFGVGGSPGAAVFRTCVDDDANKKEDPALVWNRWEQIPVPLAGSNASSGVFSLASRTGTSLVAVGGDYEKPGERVGTAAYSNDEGKSWVAAAKPPHGYRSAVEWSEALKAWVAVGTNGSDLSRDDGKTWTALDDGEWNALSLPFVVGPKGRIARLSEDRLR